MCGLLCCGGLPWGLPWLYQLYASECGGHFGERTVIAAVDFCSARQQVEVFGRAYYPFFFVPPALYVAGYDSVAELFPQRLFFCCVVGCDVEFRFGVFVQLFLYRVDEEAERRPCYGVYVVGAADVYPYRAGGVVLCGEPCYFGFYFVGGFEVCREFVVVIAEIVVALDECRAGLL